MTTRILHVQRLLELATHDMNGDYDMLDMFGSENALTTELAALAHEYAELAAKHAALVAATQEVEAAWKRDGAAMPVLWRKPVADAIVKLGKAAKS